MGDVLSDAFSDTLKVLPFLLIMNFVIELLEYRSQGLKANRILKGGYAPLAGAVVGIVPQCGFSVVATELYCKRRIALGTLLAVYIATSDEALPIMLSSYKGLQKLWPVLVIKLAFALIVGYSAFMIEYIVSRKNHACSASATPDSEAMHAHEHEHEHEHEHAHLDDACATAHMSEHAVEAGDEDTHVHMHGCHRHSLAEDEKPLDADATRRQKAARIWNVYFKHPVIHTATVLAYILAVNVILGIIVYYVGEVRLARFISSTGMFQPVLAATVGLIPNCAASVVITELYIVGRLNLGATVAGLCVSAGIGYAVLAKHNRPVKNTALIIAVMFVLSVVLGMTVTSVV